MKPRVLLRKQGMFVLDAFKGHLPSEVRYVIHAMNTGPRDHTWWDDFITTYSNK
jgi:hypothetical protein